MEKRDYPTPEYPGYLRYLRVKIDSLAAESKIILEHARKAKNPHLKRGLLNHRSGIVRTESRNSLLAYGFLNGKPYERIEPRGYKKSQGWWINGIGQHLSPFDYHRVKKLVLKYSMCDADSPSFMPRSPVLIGMFEENFYEWYLAAVDYNGRALSGQVKFPRPTREPFVYVPTPEDDAIREQRAASKSLNEKAA